MRKHRILKIIFHTLNVATYKTMESTHRCYRNSLGRGTSNGCNMSYAYTLNSISTQKSNFELLNVLNRK